MKKPDIRKLRVIVCDFDGVLTDNKVYVDQKGQEMVCCSRADGMAFNILNKLHIPTFIISSEQNPVVARRAKKLGVSAAYGVSSKLAALKKLAKKHHFLLEQALYVGNDVNDFEAMSACGFRASPKDASREIKKIANIHLKTMGGAGVVREIVSDVLGIDLVRTVRDIY